MKLFLSAAIGLLITSPALARDCGNAATQFELTQCAYDSWQESDAELNRVWRQIQRSFGKDAWNGRRKTALLKSQRAWLKFVVADCEEAAGTEWEGGSGRPMIVSSCKDQLTQQRVKLLRGRYLER